MDKTNGSVTLTLTTDNRLVRVELESDQLVITINQEATVSAGSNLNICSDQSASLSGSIGGSATSATWSTSGDGSFGNANNLSTSYTPGSNDVANGSVGTYTDHQ
jgi:hypothetical protein